MIRISNWTSTRKFYTKWEHVKFNKESHIDFCRYYAQQVCFARIISFMYFTVEEFLIHNSRWFLKNNWRNLLGLCLFPLNTYSFPAKGTLMDWLTDWRTDWLMDKLIRVGLGNLHGSSRLTWRNRRLPSPTRINLFLCLSFCPSVRAKRGM